MIGERAHLGNRVIDRDYGMSEAVLRRMKTCGFLLSVHTMLRLMFSSQRYER